MPKAILEKSLQPSAAPMASGLWRVLFEASQDVFDVTILHQRKDDFAGRVLAGLVKDLDLERTHVPGSVEGRPDAPELDDPVSHHGARHQRILIRYRPIVDMESHYAPGRPVDLSVQIG